MDGKISVEEAIMANRINRAIELLAGDQAIYYVGGHSGHVLTRAQGREDADTWADISISGWSTARSTWRVLPNTCRV